MKRVTTNGCTDGGLTPSHASRRNGFPAITFSFTPVRESCWHLCATRSKMRRVTCEETNMKTTCFYDASIFPWTSAFVKAYADVRGEVERQAQAMRPVYDNYIESMAGAPAKTYRWLTSTLVFF